MKGIQIRFLLRVFMPSKGTFVLKNWVRREIWYRFARFTQNNGASKVTEIKCFILLYFVLVQGRELI